MADVQRKLVHKQFNSPMGLYSQQNVAETLNRELKAFGSQGIEIDEQIAKPLNLANSAVLRAVEEEEEMKCEPTKKCIRESRSRQRCFQQRPHTPVHQQQLEQIKTQYLSHQHDITIDRDTVLKINRLATRRNLHKRDHSWPPTATTTATATATVVTTTGNEPLKNVVDNGNIVQHVRSTSNDNALQFDETVCKRHGIDVIRDKFNSPTRIIEPTAQEVRQRREQQRRQQQQQQWRNRSDSGGDSGGVAQEKRAGIGVDGHGICHAKEMINLRKHEELLRKNSQNKSAACKKTDKQDQTLTTRPKISVPETKEIKDDKNVAAEDENKAEDELFQTTTVPVAKGYSHPETKAADEDIGLVEPKRQFYEQLASGKKWYSYENLLAAVNAYPTMKPVPQCSHRRQAYSLERGRDKRQHKQLPPQKPRGSPKLQRRSMKLSTEIKISYDADAQQHNIQVKSLNQPKKPAVEDSLEHIPLPAIPDNSKTHPIGVERKADDSKEKSITEPPVYDDSCIFLRSIDLQDNTVAYIPAAITIVPSPTEEIMQHWMESNNLKANIKEARKSGSNNKQQNLDNLITTHGGEKQQRDGKQDVIETKATDNDTYVTHLPCTSNGIQLTRQTIKGNTKQHYTQMSCTGKTAATTPTAGKSQGLATTNATQMLSTTEGNKTKMKTTQKGVYYTDGEYVYGPYDPSNGKPLSNAMVRSLEVVQQQKRHVQQQQQPQIKKDIDAERKCNQQQEDRNDIANLTAKYEHIQKSINEHLKQIDAYIESAKTALKSTVPASASFGNRPAESSSHRQTDQHQHPSDFMAQHQLLQQQQQQQHEETPLKEILRKITNIMQEVKPLSRNQNAYNNIGKVEQQQQQQQQEPEEENMPIVDKVLMDLNLLTTHLSEFDKASSSASSTVAQLKPIIEQFQQQQTTPAINLQFETRPTPCQLSYVLLQEDLKGNEEIPLNKAEGQIPAATTSPSPPPPPPSPPSLAACSSAMPALRKEQKKHMQQHIKDEQLLATDKKLITVQNQPTPPPPPPPAPVPVPQPAISQSQSQGCDAKKHKKMTTSTVSAATPKDDKHDKDENEYENVEKKKNTVFDFIAQHQQQEQLVEQVIDTLGKMENKSKENLVNTHVQQTTAAASTPAPAIETADEQHIKSNLNQQTPATKHTTSASATATTSSNDVVVIQNCNVNVLANASSKNAACNHDNDPKSTKGNESQLKLHIKDDFTDKMADKQFQKYDNQQQQLTTRNTNDVVVNSNIVECGPRQPNKHVCQHHDDSATKADDKKFKDIIKPQQNQQECHVALQQKKIEKKKEKGVAEADDDSNRSSGSGSGSDLSNTYKSSYELPSPYITVRQISWENVQPKITSPPPPPPPSPPPPPPSPFTETKATATQTHSPGEGKAKEADLKTSVNIVKPKHDKHTAQHKSVKSPETLSQIEPTSLAKTTMLTKPKTAAASGHVEMQSTTATKPRKQTRKQQHYHHHQHYEQKQHQQPLKTPYTAEDIRKYPAPLIEPHVPTRATSPFGLNAVEIPNKLKQRSTTPSPSPSRRLTSPSPLRTGHEELMQAIRKYPSPLVEPHLPTRATSPFGLNAVEMKNSKRSKSASPPQSVSNDSSARKYPAPLVEPHVPTRASSPFGLNAVDMGERLHTTIRATTPLPPPYALAVDYQIDDDEQHKDKPDSPIRKYPPALIEPHVPTRAASPFGLNPVVVDDAQMSAHRQRTPSPAPARGQQYQQLGYHHYHPQATATKKSSSTASRDDSNRKLTVVYVPQVEGHDIGLLVRATTPIPYHPYNLTNVSEISATNFAQIISAAKTLHDTATTTTMFSDITGNKNWSTNNIVGRDDENSDDNAHISDSDDDDAATCDELQRINTIGSSKQGTTTTVQMQQRKQHHQQQHKLSHALHEEPYCSGHPGSMPIDTIPLPISVINRSFDNVSPRPYITIEGYKRVAWPPASEERIVREFTPQPQTQYQPVPAYNQQQQQQQQPPSAASAAPDQAPIYNNVSHQAPTNINNMARDCNSPYKPNLNPNQIQYEAFPPQTPETPIILKDKQFSRQASQEPNQTNTLPYHQQQHHQQQQQQYQYQQPQNQPIQQYGQQQYGQQQQQQQHYQHHQEPYYQQQQQQQPIHYPSNQQEQMPQQQQLEQHAPSGWKPIRPPQTKQEHLFTSPSGIRESTPSMTAPVYQQQYQSYQQQPQQQPPQQNHQQQYRAPSYDIYQQPQQQHQQQPPQQQYPPQAQYQSQAPLSQNQYQQPPQAVSHYQQQPPQQQPAWAHQQQQSQQQQPQQQYQQPPWLQQSQQNQQYQQSQYQSPLNQYNQAPIHHQAQQQYQQQPQQQQQYNNQFVSQSNQQQFNSYSQPQQQQHTVSHDQVDQHAKLAQEQRGVSPGIITLRKEAPITQKPAPVYSSQPAAISFRGGSSMRGDLKWPPPEYKEAAVKENEERRKLALGPVCRPRKINRDYTAFFAKNALSHHYPSYKVPPGTQHMTY